MKIIIPKQSFSSFLITITVIILAIFSPINNNNTIIQYWDEFFTFFSAVNIICFINKIIFDNHNKKFLKIFFLLLFLIILIGLISNYRFRITTNNTSILIDLLGIIKVPIVFIYTFMILSNNEKKAILSNLRFLSEIFIFSAFICSLINLVADIGMSYGVRYGVRNFTFFYRNPAALNTAIISAYSIISVWTSRRLRIFFLTLTTIVVVLTFRGMGIGAISVFIIFEIYTHFKKKNSQISIKKLVPISLVAFVLGYNQIEEYFIGSDSIRNLFLQNSFIILKRYFPLGSGFATYGSDQAYKNYSKLYYEFGYNNIYFLMPGNGAVANDNFWPMVIAQFGFIGFWAYLAMVVLQMVFVFGSKLDDKIKIIVISLLILAFIISLGNAVYTSAMGMLIYIVAGIVYLPKSEGVYVEK